MNEIFVYNFSDLKLDKHIETCLNPKGLLFEKYSIKKLYIGLCSLNNDVTNTILASPDKKTGHVLLHLYDLNKKTTIKAHQSTLSFIELSSKGNKLATSSEKVNFLLI